MVRKTSISATQKNCAFAHLVSADLKTKDGTTLDFVPIKNSKVGTCVASQPQGKQTIFSLIIKKHSSSKPTYFDFEQALYNMKEQAQALDIKTITILHDNDILNQARTQDIIRLTFQNTGIKTKLLRPKNMAS